MALSGFDFISSFLGGVQERAQEYDDALATRIKELADKGPSDITKSKFKADYDEYLADKKLAQAITSAGVDSDQGQFLLGGYKTMDDYVKARDANPDLYHEMFKVGQVPNYTDKDYGVTNIRDDGSQITTAGQMFDQFFRPDVHKERIGELTPTPTEATYTSYRRAVDAEGNQVNPRDPEDIEKSREVVKARAIALQSAGEHDKLPEEMEVKSLDEDNNSITQKYVKIPNPSDEYLKSEAGLAAEKVVGLPGYQKVGVPVFTENSEFAQSLRNLGPKPTDGDKEVLADWIYKFNTLVYGATMADTIERDGRPKLNTILTGLYNENDREVSIRYTENPDDVFMKGTEFEMIGWKQIGKEAPEDTPDEITVHKLIDGVMHTYSLMKTSNTDIGTALEGYDGYRVMGEPVPTNAISNLQEKLNEHGTEPDRSKYDTDEMYESAIDIWRKGYNKILYGVTSLEDSDSPAVGTVIDGVLNDKGVKVKVQYTGKSTDNFMNMEGYRLFGGDEEAAPTPSIDSTVDIYNSKDNTVQQVRYTGTNVPYTDYLGKTWEGYEVVGGPKPVEESFKFTTTTNSLGEEIKLLHTGLDKDVVFEGTAHERKGWIQIGFAKPVSGTSLKPLDLFYQAAADGKNVSDELLAAARIEYSQRDTAIEQSIEEKLKMFDKLSVMVRDYSTLPLEKIVEEVDADEVGTGVFNVIPNASEPATNAYIKVYAKYLGVTERVLKEALLQKILTRDAKHKEQIEKLINTD